MYHIVASGVACLGMVTSLLALVGERLKWGSFSHFSVATKVPVEVFCISGPIVMVTFLLYGILAFLLATERATSTVFYISAFWSIIFTDMSLILYRDWKDMFKRNFDICLHTVNLTVVSYSFINMPYMPTTFLLISLGMWGCIVMARVVKRYFEKHRPRLPSREVERSQLNASRSSVPKR